MKNIIYVIAALAAASGLRAEEPASAYSITSDFTYTSEYIFRGVENSAGAFQPSVELTSGDFNLGVWTSQPITKENNEIDLYAGYTLSLSNVKLEGVVTTYWYPEATTNQTKSTYELGVGATLNAIHGLSPSLYVYHDFRLESNTVQAAVGYSLPLEALGSSIDTSVYFGSVNMEDSAPDNQGAAIADSYSYYGIDASIPFKLSKSATFTVGGHYAVNRGLAGVGGPGGSLGEKNFWVTAGISIGF